MASSLSAMPTLAQEVLQASDIKTFKTNEQKPKNNYNITINYELGMHSRLPH